MNDQWQGARRSGEQAGRNGWTDHNIGTQDMKAGRRTDTRSGDHPPVTGRVIMRVRNTPTAHTCACGHANQSGKPQPVVLEPQSDGTYAPTPLNHFDAGYGFDGSILLPASDGWARVGRYLVSVAAVLALIVGFALMLRDSTTSAPAPSRLPVTGQSWTDGTWTGQDTDEVIQGAFRKVIDLTHGDR